MILIILFGRLHEIDVEVSVNITAQELVVVSDCSCMAGKEQAIILMA